MAAKSFEEQVEEALEGLPKEQIVAFAWRCAVRALPFLGAKGDFDFWKRKIGKNICTAYSMR